MARVSKQKLSQKHLKDLFIELNTIIEKLNRDSSEAFLGELLGTEEKIMIAKRFAAIVMLIEGN